jgi:hypothetical protein
MGVSNRGFGRGFQSRTEDADAFALEQGGTLAYAGVAGTPGKQGGMSPGRPILSVTERASGVRIQLGRLAHGDGDSLQEAADDLLRRVLVYAGAVRQSGFSTSCELAPDLDGLAFLYEIGELAEAGGDVRAALFA